MTPKTVSAEERADHLMNSLVDWDGEAWNPNARMFLIDSIKAAVQAAIQKDRDERTAQDLYQHSYNKGLRAGQEMMREIMNKAIQELGAPVMDYAPEYAVKEYDAKIARAVTILSALPIEEERKS